MKTMIVIPALNPPEFLEQYIDALLQHPSIEILLINDGSDKRLEGFFNTLSQKNGYII